jgi:hypothetical protein
MCESMFEKENLQMGQVKISIRIFRLKTQNFILFLFIHLFIYFWDEWTKWIEWLC